MSVLKKWLFFEGLMLQFQHSCCCLRHTELAFEKIIYFVFFSSLKQSIHHFPSCFLLKYSFWKKSRSRNGTLLCRTLLEVVWIWIGKRLSQTNQFLLWSINELWLKDEFGLYIFCNCICQCLRMDSEQMQRDEHLQWTAHQAAVWNGRMVRKMMLAAACSFCSSTSLPGRSPLMTMQTSEKMAPEPLGSREEKNCSGDSLHRQKVYHFVFLHCNSNYKYRGQFLLSTKQLTSGNYIRVSI